MPERKAVGPADASHNAVTNYSCPNLASSVERQPQHHIHYTENEPGPVASAKSQDGCKQATQNIRGKKFSHWKMHKDPNSTVGSMILSSKCAYQLAKHLQSAIYGAVYLADEYGLNGRWRRPVAMKIMLRELERRHRGTLQEDIFAELKFHKEMKGHAALIAYDDLWEDRDCVYLVMPYADHEDLFEVLKKRRKPFAEREARWLFYQILEGTAYLHSAGVAFRDHSLENILMFRTEGGNIVPRITDPGQAMHIQLDDMNRVKGVVSEKLFGKSFRPPEVYNSKPYNPLKVDTFCIGWMLFFAVTKHQPFDRAVDSDPHWNLLKKGRYRDLLAARGGSTLSASLCDLLWKMMLPDYNLRPTVKQCLEHKWFRDGHRCPLDERTLYGMATAALDHVPSHSSTTMEKQGKRQSHRRQKPNSLKKHPSRKGPSNTATTAENVPEAPKNTNTTSTTGSTTNMNTWPMNLSTSVNHSLPVNHPVNQSSVIFGSNRQVGSSTKLSSPIFVTPNEFEAAQHDKQRLSLGGVSHVLPTFTNTGLCSGAPSYLRDSPIGPGPKSDNVDNRNHRCMTEREIHHPKAATFSDSLRRPGFHTSRTPVSSLNYNTMMPLVLDNRATDCGSMSAAAAATARFNPTVFPAQTKHLMSSCLLDSPTDVQPLRKFVPSPMAADVDNAHSTGQHLRSVSNPLDSPSHIQGTEQTEMSTCDNSPNLLTSGPSSRASPSPVGRMSYRTLSAVCSSSSMSLSSVSCSSVPPSVPAVRSEQRLHSCASTERAAASPRQNRLVNDRNSNCSIVSSQEHTMQLPSNTVTSLRHDAPQNVHFSKVPSCRKSAVLSKLDYAASGELTSPLHNPIPSLDKPKRPSNQKKNPALPPLRSAHKHGKSSPKINTRHSVPKGDAIVTNHVESEARHVEAAASATAGKHFPDWMPVETSRLIGTTVSNSRSPSNAHVAPLRYSVQSSDEVSSRNSIAPQNANFGQSPMFSPKTIAKRGDAAGASPAEATQNPPPAACRSQDLGRPQVFRMAQPNLLQHNHQISHTKYLIPSPNSNFLVEATKTTHGTAKYSQNVTLSQPRPSPAAMPSVPKYPSVQHSTLGSPQPSPLITTPAHTISYSRAGELTHINRKSPHVDPMPPYFADQISYGKSYVTNSTKLPSLNGSIRPLGDYRNVGVANHGMLAKHASKQPTVGLTQPNYFSYIENHTHGALEMAQPCQWLV